MAQADGVLADVLAARVSHARTRMLYGHMPVTAWTLCGFTIVIGGLIHFTLPTPSTWPTQAWLLVALVLAVTRALHAQSYFRAADRLAPFWQHSYYWLTLVFGLCWSALPWALPVRNDQQLATAIIGVMIGMAATGAAQISSDRANVRAWTVPILVSSALYCANTGGPLGWFGFISIMGFLVILWLEADRAHHRIGEMLRLRFESEALAQARAQALHEAESLSAAKGRFLATMSHEMRTPLHGILGLSRMLLSRMHRPEDLSQIGLLHNAGEHLLGVINDVLDFSRLKDHGLRLNPRPVLINELARHVCELSQVTAQDKGLVVMLRSSLPDDLWLILDPDRLRQVLTNLVGNAVKFTTQGHVIVRMGLEPAEAIAGAEGDCRVTFEVQDTGRGIPEAHLDKVFDAFHQVDARDGDLVGGTGLGLSISQQICVAMGGQLRCESRVGIGTTFSFTLSWPRTNRPPSDAAEAGLRQDAFGDEPATLRLAGRVLVVEDNPVNVLVAQATLERLGLEVVVADNGRRALEWLRAHEPDLVLMDFHMPLMGGIEATRRIRELELQQGWAPVPIVAMSAGDPIDDHRHCLEVGMNDHIRKPFVPSDMNRVLRRHLGVRVGRRDPAARSPTPASAVA
ncbi:signal transduction histidine kinase [Aquabacterium commune]|uniref:Virulence sensor protein BvgS n=2 Tax=Aquabacterium TaxID=92793 RepID=A0A4R6RIC7_9BURK|nr:ATP-binding protein [Aquabacterium commune]TDP85855.1 signal transduction histidine kinase [Aquabacterium commune]